MLGPTVMTYLSEMMIFGKWLSAIFLLLLLASYLLTKLNVSLTVLFATWISTAVAFAGVVVLVLMPGIKDDDLALGKRWLEECSVIEKYERHSIGGPTNRLLCHGVEEQVDAEAYQAFTIAFQERGEQR